MSLSIGRAVIAKHQTIQNGRAVKTKVKKAVLLAGGEGRRLTPLTKQYPPFMFPVFGEPLIEHNIEFLARRGIENVILVLSKNTETMGLESIREKNKEKIKIDIYKEAMPRGTAGILGDIVPFLEDQPFLVINSSLFIDDIDLEGLLNFHDSKKAVATVGVRRNRDKVFTPKESIKISEEGLIENIHILHHSRERRSPWLFSGVYLFRPEVLEFIDPKKYLDIKEQLIPLLQEASLPVCAYELNGYYRSINSIEDYFRVHRDLFKRNSNALHLKNKEEIIDQVWVGKDTTISPGAYLIGPIVIGDGCSIAKGAQIIGPAVIGGGCKLSEGAVVRESVLWRDVFLGKRARSEYCIVHEGLSILEDERVNNLVVVDNLQRSDINLMVHDCTPTKVGRKNLVCNLNNWAFNLVKRAMDISIALIAFVILSPLFILIALAIRMDSPGSIFFIQKRCGKDGRKFDMFKFRTMFADAEKMHVELLSQKDTDGPMFKMANDPRITRVGKILRETSLDEITQLINVIKGEMSLVGPRPLIMDEMKFSPSWRDVRLKVKPGITGLWQVQGRSEAPFHDWIRYDVNYVKNQSIWLDLKILFKTVRVVFKKIGAY